VKPPSSATSSTRTILPSVTVYRVGFFVIIQLPVLLA
jgi:hypothetical protein